MEVKWICFVKHQPLLTVPFMLLQLKVDLCRGGTVWRFKRQWESGRACHSEQLITCCTAVGKFRKAELLRDTFYCSSLRRRLLSAEPSWSARDKIKYWSFHLKAVKSRAALQPYGLCWVCLWFGVIFRGVLQDSAVMQQ